MDATLSLMQAAKVLAARAWAEENAGLDLNSARGRPSTPLGIELGTRYSVLVRRSPQRYERTDVVDRLAPGPGGSEDAWRMWDDDGGTDGSAQSRAENFESTWRNESE